jgi:hypothetical protein
LSFGTRCIARTAKIDAVSGDERPILPRLMLGCPIAAARKILRIL